MGMMMMIVMTMTAAVVVMVVMIMMTSSPLRKCTALSTTLPQGISLSAYLLIFYKNLDLALRSTYSPSPSLPYLLVSKLHFPLT
jgi:hypothetical protein